MSRNGLHVFALSMASFFSIFDLSRFASVSASNTVDEIGGATDIAELNPYHELPVHKKMEFESRRPRKNSRFADNIGGEDNESAYEDALNSVLQDMPDVDNKIEQVSTGPQHTTDEIGENVDGMREHNKVKKIKRPKQSKKHKRDIGRSTTPKPETNDNTVTRNSTSSTKVNKKVTESMDQSEQHGGGKYATSARQITGSAANTRNKCEICRSVCVEKQERQQRCNRREMKCRMNEKCLAKSNELQYKHSKKNDKQKHRLLSKLILPALSTADMHKSGWTVFCNKKTLPTYAPLKTFCADYMKQKIGWLKTEKKYLKKIFKLRYYAKKYGRMTLRYNISTRKLSRNIEKLKDNILLHRLRKAKASFARMVNTQSTIAKELKVRKKLTRRFRRRARKLRNRYRKKKAKAKIATRSG